LAELGGPAALRGFRLQALYTLDRLLRLPDGCSIQPEGREDLDVLDSAGMVLEVVQVKAYATALTLSDFDLRKARGFFQRVKERRNSAPSIIEAIVSFGPFGPRMQEAWHKDGAERDEATRLFAEAGFSADDVRSFFARVTLLPVDVAMVQHRVAERLRETLVGVDLEAALDLLRAWLFVAMETRQLLTLDDLRKRILAIGRFVSEREAKHQEWFRSIVPLVDAAPVADSTHLRREFYAGVAARFDHILNHLDVRREGPLKAIEGAFETNRMVVIRGASGQGKTALAYRFLWECVPDGWRFEIRLVESRFHALNVALALLGHLRAIGVPAVVYIDVSPGDQSWLQLISELAGYPLVKILVTIREEDWRRAASATTIMPLSEIELRFTKEEAIAIYDSLLASAVPEHILNFEDAWLRFGTEGPLLEFTYLVAQNETLVARLSDQVRRLRDEVRLGVLTASELDLLRQVSVAAAYGARIDLAKVAEVLSLPEPTRTIEIFEREFLLRVADKGAKLEGLHPIRSKILVGLLTDSTVQPWGKAAARCLPAICPSDLEEFLLHAFRYRREEKRALQETLRSSSMSATWSIEAATFRAVLWGSVDDCLTENRAVIEQASVAFGQGWPLQLMLDVGNVNAVAPGLVTPLAERLKDMVDQSTRDQVAKLRADARIDGVLQRAHSWLASIGAPIEEPSVVEDWIGLAELAFWTQHLGLEEEVAPLFPLSQLSQAAEHLPLEVLADVVYAVSFLNGKEARASVEAVRPIALARFQKETDTPAIEDDGRVIRAHFLVDPKLLSGQDEGNEARSNQVHAEAMRRVRLLRRLVREREAFGCQGYGHNLDVLPLEGDDSTKTGIPANTLPPQWPLRANITFNRLGEYAFRPAHWSDYARSVKEVRETATSLLERLAIGLDRYFRDPRHPDVAGNAIRIEALDDTSRVLSRLPPFPKDAVDGWGQTSETATRESEGDSSAKLLKDIIPALQQHAGYRKALRAYVSPLGNFIQQAGVPITAVPYFARAKDPNELGVMRKALVAMGQDEEPARMPLTNLFDAWTELEQFQREFRALFARLLDQHELETLEQRELTAFSQLFPLWLQFATNPRLVLAKGVIDADRAFKAASADVIRRLRGKLKKLERYGVRATVLGERVLWEGKRALWIGLTVADERNLTQAFWVVFEQIARSLPDEWTGSLEDFAVRHRWETIHVVPLVAGRVYDGGDWRLPTTLILGSLKRLADIKWWYGALRPISAETLQELDLVAADFAVLAPVSKVFATSVQLQIVLSSINDVAKMPETTGVGAEVKRDYAARRSSEVSTLAAEALDGMSQLATALTRAMNETESKSPEAELLTATAESLQAFWSVLVPEGLVDGKGSLGDAEMKQWNERMASGMPALAEMKLAFIVYQRLIGGLV